MRQIEEHQIVEFKEDIVKILAIIHSLRKVWNSNKLTMVSVLVQNMCFHSNSLNALSAEKEYLKMKDILNVLEEIAYSDTFDHTVNWIVEEIKMSWDNYWISIDDTVEK